jgi:hypothetical protein
MLAVSQLQARDLAGDHAAAGVGEERRHPVPVDVGEGELRPDGGVPCAGSAATLPATTTGRSCRWPRRPRRRRAAPRLRSPGASTGGDQIHDGLDALIDREPEGELHPSLRQAAANRCVAPAESERASTRGEPGSPGRGRVTPAAAPAPSSAPSRGQWRCYCPRCRPAAGRPAPPRPRPPAGPKTPAAGGIRMSSSRWPPRSVPVLWAMLIVASKSIRSSPPRSGAAPASQARSRAAARAARTRARCGASIRSSSRSARSRLTSLAEVVPGDLFTDRTRSSPLGTAGAPRGA